MPAISNLEKARKKINEEASKIKEGGYTAEVAKSLFDSAVKEFNLVEDKVAELKAFSFERKLDQCGEEQPKPKTLEEQVENLTAALAKIATLTGYGNHLKEFQIDKWEPTKKDINKKYG